MTLVERRAAPLHGHSGHTAVLMRILDAMQTVEAWWRRCRSIRLEMITLTRRRVCQMISLGMCHLSLGNLFMDACWCVFASSRTNRYFYLSRFMFAFYIIALFFAVVALITGLLALCSRLGSYISALAVLAAAFFQALAASLMTWVYKSRALPWLQIDDELFFPSSAWTVEGREIFEDAGIEAELGVRAYAFTWTALACFLLATVIFCLSGRLGKNNRRGHNNDSSYYNDTTTAGATSNPYDTTSVTSYERTTSNANAVGPNTMRTGGRFVRFKQFGRKGKTDRERGSFAAKDEYA